MDLNITDITNAITVKDITDCFVESRKATRKAAIAVTVLDTLLTCGIAKIVYFSTLLRKEPILPELLDGPCEKLPGAENVLLESH